MNKRTQLRPHYNFPVDYSWPSPESDKIRDTAKRHFEMCCNEKRHPEIYLIASSHWASEGYWIEFTKPVLIPGMESIVIQSINGIITHGQDIPENHSGSRETADY